MYKQYSQYLSSLYSTKRYRSLPEAPQSNLKPLLTFSTNDYLCLSRHPELIHAANSAAHIYGIGSTGSRLLSGNNELFTSLETTIAQDKHTESALIFISGFQANVSALSALLDSSVLKSQPIVFFDKLNHASLYQAIFLSGAELIRYQHNNMDHLSFLLNKFSTTNRPKFIVTETIFGMDGDVLPIHIILSLASQHQAFLYLDEAHATGVIGIHGYGLSTTVKLTHIPHLIMGTFSKALGCSGGYIACTRLLKEYLINKAQGFIYSTAGSPMLLGAVSKAWQLVKTFDAQRKHLLSLSSELRRQLKQLGLQIGSTSSHIIPIILKTEDAADKARIKLLEDNILVSYIRPPTVPLGTSRIRIALNTSHTTYDIERLIATLKTL